MVVIHGGSLWKVYGGGLFLFFVFFILNRISKGQQVNLALSDSVCKISPVLFNEIIVNPCNFDAYMIQCICLFVNHSSLSLFVPFF